MPESDHYLFVVVLPGSETLELCLVSFYEILQFLGLLRCLASCKAAGSIFDLLVGELDLVQLGKSILEKTFDLLKILRE
jgi:hypothetical protein